MRTHKYNIYIITVKFNKEIILKKNETKTNNVYTDSL